MYYFDLFTTNACNLECSYCVQDRARIQNASYSMRDLKRYIETFQDEACIVFYGGEPLLNIDFIKRVTQFFAADNIRFGVQSNGTLLNRLMEAEISVFDMIRKRLFDVVGSHRRR